MNKILWHAVSLKAEIYFSPADDAQMLQIIPAGSWLGVIKEIGDWIYVIGKEGNGWTKKSQVAECSIPTLHIRSRNNTLSEKVGYIAQSKQVA